MSELMLINPRRRRRKSTKSKARRKGKMPAGLKKYWASRRKHKRNPVMAKKSKRSRRRAVGYTIGKSRIRRRKMNPSARFSPKSFMQNTLMPSAVGAAGALGIDVIMGFLPIPIQFKTGPMRAVVKVVGAAAIGYVASNFMNRNTANQIAAGAITVAMYDVFKGFLQQTMPNIPLSENDALMEEYPSLAYAGAGYTVDGMNEYVSEGGVGEYVEGDE